MKIVTNFCKYKSKEAHFLDLRYQLIHFLNQIFKVRYYNRRKAELLVQEVFDAKTRPCLSRSDLKSFCEKIKSFPFKLAKTDLLFEELKKVDLILEELKDDDLSFETCEVLVEKEQALKLDIFDMKKIQELEEVLRFLPKLNRTYTSLDAATKVIDEVCFKTVINLQSNLSRTKMIFCRKMQISVFFFNLMGFSKSSRIKISRKGRLSNRALENADKDILIMLTYLKGSELVGLEFNRSFLSRFKGN